MSWGRILVIDGDEWLGRPLARVIQQRGFATDLCADARSGFEKALVTVPDCVVCSVVLPDIDGFWVVRRIRTENGTIAKTPIVLVSDIKDADVLVQGLHVGADVVLERPVSNEEIAAQADALVAMARRLRAEPTSEEQSTPSIAAAFRGDLSNFPLASILMMLELERRTGTLEVTSATGTRAQLVLSQGQFAHTEVGGQTRTALESLREVLAWRNGRFAFRTRDVSSLPPARGSVAAVVLEAMRLEDERNAGQ